MAPRSDRSSSLASRSHKHNSSATMRSTKHSAKVTKPAPRRRTVAPSQAVDVSSDSDSEAEAQPRRKRAPRAKARRLVRWGYDWDQILLLALHKVIKENIKAFPWEEVARAMGPSNATGGAVEQHIMKMRKIRQQEGCLVPEMPQRINPSAKVEIVIPTSTTDRLESPVPVALHPVSRPVRKTRDDTKNKTDVMAKNGGNKKQQETIRIKAEDSDESDFEPARNDSTVVVKSKSKPKPKTIIKQEKVSDDERISSSEMVVENKVSTAVPSTPTKRGRPRRVKQEINYDEALAIPISPSSPSKKRKLETDEHFLSQVAADVSEQEQSENDDDTDIEDVQSRIIVLRICPSKLRSVAASMHIDQDNVQAKQDTDNSGDDDIMFMGQNNVASTAVMSSFMQGVYEHAGLSYPVEEEYDDDTQPIHGTFFADASETLNNMHDNPPAYPSDLADVFGVQTQYSQHFSDGDSAQISYVNPYTGLKIEDVDSVEKFENNATQSFDSPYGYDFVNTGLPPLMLDTAITMNSFHIPSTSTTVSPDSSSFSSLSSTSLADPYPSHNQSFSGGHFFNLNNNNDFATFFPCQDNNMMMHTPTKLEDAEMDFGTQFSLEMAKTNETQYEHIEMAYSGA